MANKATSENSTLNSDQGESDEPKNLTVEEVGKIVNSAITSRLKNFDKRFDELTALLSTNSEKPDKEKTAESKDLLKLQKQIEKLQAEKDTERAKSKDTQLRSEVKEYLTKHGVAPHLVKAAMASLLDDKMIGFDESEQLVFKSSAGDVDLSSGLKSWVKSDEGKVFVASRPVSGSGDRPFRTGGNGSANEKPGMEDIAQKLLRSRYEV